MVRWVWYPPVVDHQQLIKQGELEPGPQGVKLLLALENLMNQLKDDFARKACSCSSTAPSRALA